MDVDGGLLGSDDHLDDIYVEISLSPSSAFYPQQSYTGYYGHAEIVLSFRVQCTGDFYGPNCATYCVPTDDSSGHYTCDVTDGSKICLSGWKNPENNCLDGKNARHGT